MKKNNLLSEREEAHTFDHAPIIHNNFVVDKKSIDNFLFTRREDTDYEFIKFPNISTDSNILKEHIVKLQDYFSELVDNTGYYSFKVNANWIISQIRKTDRFDNRRRPIYKIFGNIYDINLLEEEWFSFALDTRSIKSLKYKSRSVKFNDGEYVADEQNLLSFLYDCSLKLKPISWAYGVKKKDNDLSDLNFQVRFVKTETNVIELKTNFIRRIVNRILRK